MWTEGAYTREQKEVKGQKKTGKAVGSKEGKRRQGGQKEAWRQKEAKRKERSRRAHKKKAERAEGSR